MLRLLALLLALAALPAAACGPDTDCRLTVEGAERTYRIRLPEGQGAPGPLPAILFHHGYRGSAAAVMRDVGLQEVADAYGAVLVAAETAGADWQLPNMPGETRLPGPDALAYADALRADILRRFPVDPGRMVAAGFSSGGMMVWQLACARGADYAGFVALAGTFWAPVPEACPSPAGALVHIHGQADNVVPIAGRAIGDARQGDLNDAVRLYARHGGFGPARGIRIGDLLCGMRTNPEGAILEVCLHEGGHAFTASLLAFGLERLAGVGRFPVGRRVVPGER